MTITGVFDDTFENRYQVYIKDTVSTDQSTYTIGEDGLYFTDDPISIECENEDNFNHIIKKSANINLYTDNYIGHRLFAGNTNISVNILKNGVPIFAGVVLPVSFSQEYSQLHDSFTLNCVDFLTTLTYTNYKNITAANFTNNKRMAKNVSFGEIISGAITPILESEVICPQVFDRHIYYDRSKGTTSADTTNALYNMSISEQVLIGEDYEQLMNNEEVLEEVLKFLNLHIHQDGFNFYVYDWDSIRQQTTDWCDLISLSAVTMPSSRVVELTEDIWMSENTNLTVADVYNQISVKSQLDDQEDLVASPLDSDMLYNLFDKKSLYARSYISWGNGESARYGMYQMLYEGGTTYGAGYWVDYFVEVKNNPNWKCYIDSGVTAIDTIYPQDSKGNFINQTYVPLYMRQHTMCPAILSMGRINGTKYEMTDRLCIPILGNGDDSEANRYPKDSDIRAHYGMIEYVGNESGGVYSPADDETTNYLVFSGNLILQNYQPRTANYPDIKTDPQPSFEDWSRTWRNSFMVSPETGGDCFHVVQTFDDSGNTVNAVTMEPYFDGIGYWRDLEYTYSQVNDTTDRIGKLPVLECEMIIGNKRLVEENMDAEGNSTYKWYTLGQEPYWVDQNGSRIYEDGQPVRKTTFTLGINPYIGSFIVGQSWDLQNTVPVGSDIDASGTAIPIKRSDNLSGPVIFRILGPVNNMWNTITRRHPTFFRSTKWGEEWKYVLSHTTNIYIDRFSCKVYTDSTNNTRKVENAESDLVYVSAESTKFIDKKDDITFKFCTQITSQEAKDKGLKLEIYMNTIIDSEGGALTSIYNARTNETAKAEEHYVDQYYREFSTPKLILECDLKDEDINFRNHYYNHNLNKTFYLLSVGYEGTNGSRHVKLKEL